MGAKQIESFVEDLDGLDVCETVVQKQLGAQLGLAAQPAVDDD